MPFYEVLKILTTDKSSRRFRRKSWSSKRYYIPNFICSIIYPNQAKIYCTYGDNPTGMIWSPSIGDITATDWEEVLD